MWNNSALYELYRRLRGIYRAYAARVIHISRSALLAGDQYPDAPIETYHGSLAPNKSQVRAAGARLKVYNTRIRILIDRIQSMGAIPIIVKQLRGGFSEIGSFAKYKPLTGYPIEEMVENYVL